MITWLKKINSYIVGMTRYHLYYSKGKFLLPLHIVEQFEFRVKVMNRECYESGSCISCGCQTTALQFANKTCDNVCYPVMMGRSDWNKFKQDGRTNS